MIKQNKDIPKGYKMTELGPLPEEWRIARISKIAKTATGGTPSRSNANYFNGNIHWVKSGELNDSLISKVEEQITQDALKHSSAKIFPKGTLLMAMYGATVGKVGILGMDAATNQAVCAIFPDACVYSGYLFYAVMSRRAELLLARYGGAQPNIRQTLIRNSIVPLPPLAEQKKIAAVLSAVQQAKEKTEGVIASLRELGKSLMKHLFTYGPVPVDEADEVELKETEIGDMPEEWHVKPLVDIATLQRGKDLPKQKQVTGPYPVIGSSGIIGYHKEYVVEGPGVVTGRSGSIGKLTYTDNKYWPHNTGLYVKDFHGNIPIFIYYLLQKLDFRKYATGVSVPTLNRNFIHSALLALPPKHSQQRISKILRVIDERIKVEENKKKTLDKLFQTLLHDLMTAKIRVNDSEVPT